MRRKRNDAEKKKNWSEHSIIPNSFLLLLSFWDSRSFACLIYRAEEGSKVIAINSSILVSNRFFLQSVGAPSRSTISREGLSIAQKQQHWIACGRSLAVSSFASFYSVLLMVAYQHFLTLLLYACMCVTDKLCLFCHRMIINWSKFDHHIRIVDIFFMIIIALHRYK
jgi:hypothetical protein